MTNQDFIESCIFPAINKCLGLPSKEGIAMAQREVNVFVTHWERIGYLPQTIEVEVSSNPLNPEHVDLRIDPTDPVAWDAWLREPVPMDEAANAAIKKSWRDQGLIP